jgi:O-antigen/teichoic acid export membrane protein
MLRRALASGAIGPAQSQSSEPSGDVLSTTAAGPAAARGGGLRVAGYLVGTLVGVVAVSLLFRHLGVVATGQYVTALSLVAIVAAVSDLGLTAVGVRELSRRSPDERWPLARQLLGLRITLTTLGSLVIVAIAWFVYSPMLAAGVALACVGLLLQVTQDNFALPLLVGLRLGWVAALEFARLLLTTVLIIVLVLAGATLVPFLGVSIPVGAVVLLATVLLVRGTRSLKPAFSFSRWRAFIGPMLPYSAAVAASLLYFRVSILLVSVLGSAHELGYFSASFRIIEVLTAVPGLLVASALPIFAHSASRDHDRLGYALGRVFEVALIVGGWVAVSIAVGAPLAIAIVGGPKFKPAVPVLAVQGVALGAMFVTLVWANGLLGLGVYRVILAINIGGLLFTAALVAPLVLADGAQGAAIGTAIGEIVAALANCLAAIHRRPQLRPSLRIVPGVALAAALGLAPLAMTGIPVIARLVISTALFAGALLVTRAYPPELIELLRNLRGRPASRAS